MKLVNAAFRAKYLLSETINLKNQPYACLPSSFLRAEMKKLQAIRDRRVAYVISTGRGGSGFLAKLLGDHLGVHAYHEPVPKMTGPFLAKRANEKSRTRASLVKLYATCRKLKELPENDLYVETSHMFIKTFSHCIAEFFRDARVIHLRRDEAKILRSCLELNYFSPNNLAWKSWMFVPEGFEHCTPAEKCIAYIREIDRLAQQFRTDNRVHVFDVDIDSLNDPAEVNRLLKFLSLPTLTSDELPAAANRRDSRKKNFKTDISLDECRRAISDFDEKWRA